MVQDIELPLGTWRLERGCDLADDVVRARLVGERGPLLVVMGGISGDRFVSQRPDGTPGWWSPLVRAGGPINTDAVRVLGLDFAPGSDAGDSVCPEAITTHDQAERLARLLEHLGERAAGVVGSSYGGMVGLALAERHPSKVERLCIISAAHRPYPIGVAWRGIQRRVVRLALQAGKPEAGLGLARELAMTTYRTAEEFADRFPLEETASDPARFDICDYLGARGQAFAARMEAERFLALSESIDLHRVEPERITQPTLLVGATSDQLAPIPDLRTLRDRLGGPADLVTITSLYGHDAFLKEWDALGGVLGAWMRDLQRSAQ